MIRFSRISAIIVRNLIPIFRDPMRIIDIVYWPIIDIVLFGFMFIWSQSGVEASSNVNTLMILTCIVLWFIVNRSAIEISRNLLFEFWDNSLVNLLASPIKLSELTIALMIVAFIHSLISAVYGIFIVWFIFSINILSIILNILPYLLLLILSGYFIGIFIIAIIFYFGKNSEMLAWTVPWTFAVFGGAYYPMQLLPPSFQKIAYAFPMAHIFDSIRIFIATGKSSYFNLIIPSILTIFYLFLTCIFLLFMFNKSKERGISRLE